MEIYLKHRRVQHAGLTHNLPVQKTIEKTCRMIRQQGKGKDNHRRSSKEKDMEEWSRICYGEVPIKGQKELGKIAAFREWENSWPHQIRNEALRQRPTADPKAWNAAKIYTDKSGKEKLSLKGTPFHIHKGLKRAQSSIAMQIRSEHIGLKSYLHRRKVPGVDSPNCPCGYLSRNVKHAIMACPQWAKGRAEVWRKSKSRSFVEMMNNPEDLGRITQWILDQSWLEQFRLVGEVERQVKEREEKRMRRGVGV
ncbi:hypothetical protein K3495_g13018 [Podosphaera aphanis]|nr:hypothetical protein K3495_g13018 [Podosphaera aphanis]